MKFTIRDVLLVTMIVGISAGWWADHRRLESKAIGWRMCAGGLEEVLLQTGQTVEWNWEHSQVYVTQPSGVSYAASTVTWPADSGRKLDLTCLK